MNATEQRGHRTVTQELDRKLTDVAVVVEAISTNADVLHRRQTHHHERIIALEQQLAEQAAHINMLSVQVGAGERNVLAVLDRTSDLDAGLAAFREQSFWQRLMWLVVGR